MWTVYVTVLISIVSSFTGLVDSIDKEDAGGAVSATVVLILGSVALWVLWTHV